MLLRVVHYLVVLTFCWFGLAPVGARAQARAGTFAGGFGHSLSIRADGTLWAVGNNYAGQLGDGATAGPVLDAAGLPAGLYLVRATAPGQPAQAGRLLVE